LSCCYRAIVLFRRIIAGSGLRSHSACSSSPRSYHCPSFVLDCECVYFPPDDRPYSVRFRSFPTTL
jgi:hypothetical protein